MGHRGDGGHALARASGVWPAVNANSGSTATQLLCGPACGRAGGGGTEHSPGCVAAAGGDGGGSSAAVSRRGCQQRRGQRRRGRGSGRQQAVMSVQAQGPVAPAASASLQPPSHRAAAAAAVASTSAPLPQPPCAASAAWRAAAAAAAAAAPSWGREPTTRHLAARAPTTGVFPVGRVAAAPFGGSATGNGTGGAAATTLAALPCEVLAAVAALLEREDRAALAAAFAGGRAAVAAATGALRLPLSALVAAPARAWRGAFAGAGAPDSSSSAEAVAERLAAALRARPTVSSLAVVGARDPLTVAAAMAAAPASAPAPDALGALLGSLGALRRLSRVDVSDAPSAFFERLARSPQRLLASLAASAPALEVLELSAELWHAPARAAAANALTQAPPAAFGLAAGAVPACEAHFAPALLSRALAAQARREDLGALAPLARLRALGIAGAAPAELLPQLAALPPALSRLRLGCALLADDAALGRALGGLPGLAHLTLGQLPSADGALFPHMAPLTRLTHLELSHGLTTAAGLAPLAAALPSLESLTLVGCAALHSPCRAQLPEAVTRLSRLATLYLDFTLHVRDVQVR